MVFAGVQFFAGIVCALLIVNSVAIQGAGERSAASIEHRSYNASGVDGVDPFQNEALAASGHTGFNY